MRLQNKYIAEIRNRGKIADHPRKAHLRTATIINAKAQTVLDGSRHDLTWDALGPIAVAQKSMNDIQIEAGRVGAYNKFSTTVLDDAGCHLDILNG